MSALVATAGQRPLPAVLGAALGVVLTTGILFAGIGAIRGGDDVGGGGDGGLSTPVAEGSDDGGDGAPDGTPSASTPGDDGGSSEGVDPTPLDDPSSADEATPTDGATTPTADGSTAEATEGDDASPSETPNGVDPASVTIQVLDAVPNDGGSAARAVAEELRQAGFDVIVVNPASIAYDVTTVFWTEGEGPKGRAVATVLGTDEARVTPAEVQLSSSVDVHVVVGRDRS